MSSNITVTELKETVAVTENTNSVTVTSTPTTVNINTIATKTDVGLGNVDNTSDANKPVSTAVQTALDLKANSANPSLSGTATLGNGFVFAGDFSTKAHRPTWQSNTGTQTALRILPPSNTTNNLASVTFFTNTDYDNADLLNIGSRVSSTGGLRITTGKNTGGTIGSTTQDITINNNATTIATINHSGTPSNSTDLTTKSYVDGAITTAVAAKDNTDEITEGSTNLYFTTGRARSAISASGSLSYSDGVISYTTPSTSGVAEGSNLYHTTARARSSVSGGTGITYSSTDGVINVDTSTIATKSFVQAQVSANELATTSDLPEGVNLYYTTARANTDFDSRLATKSTSNLAEGSNQYFTTARARGSVSGGTGINYTESTGAIAVDSTIATKSYADAAAASAAAAIVDTAPATLDTLNELAAALGDDPNFATTVSTALGNKLNTASFGSAFDGQLSGKTTTDLAEGTNLYHTTARARSAISVSGSLSYNSSTGVLSYTTPTYATVASTGAYSDLTGKPTAISSFTNDANYITTSGARSALSGGTGVTYDSSTGAINIGQAVATTSTPTFATITTTGNLIKGAVRNSTTNGLGDTWALNASSTAQPFRGVSIDNSTDTSRNAGYIARNYSNNNTNRARFIFERARGTAASPNEFQYGDFLGEVCATGYSSTGWINDSISAVPGFFGFTAQENWVSNTNVGTGFGLSLAPTATTVTGGGNLIPILALTPQGSTLRSDIWDFQLGKSGTTSLFTINSTNASFGVPTKFVSMSTTQRDALTPAGGWVIWNSTLTKLQVYTGSAWQDLN